MAESISAPEFPIPPANFTFLVESILMQAQIQLGLLHFGEDEEEEEPEPNLPLARHSIDTLAMLQEKTKGNLTVEEQRLLENGLTELRFRFVQISDELKDQGQPRILVDQGGDRQEKKDDRPLIITPDGGKGSKAS